jgi:hypothetical protein
VKERPVNNTQELPDLFSAASASKRLGVDARTVQTHAQPSAWLRGTDGQRWPLYSADDLDNMTVTEHMQRRARRSS